MTVSCLSALSQANVISVMDCSATYTHTHTLVSSFRVGPLSAHTWMQSGVFVSSALKTSKLVFALFTIK